MNQSPKKAQQFDLNLLMEVLIVLSVQVLLIYTWWLTGLPKFIDAGYATFFEEKFKDTFLATLPGGIRFQMWILGAAELVAGAIAVVALFKREAFSGALIWTRLSLAFSALTFCMLGFGLRWIKDHAGSGNIFYYMGAVGVLYLWIQSIEKNR